MFLYVQDRKLSISNESSMLTLTCRTVSLCPLLQHDGGGENDEEQQEVEEGNRTHGHVGLVVGGGAGIQF